MADSRLTTNQPQESTVKELKFTLELKETPPADVVAGFKASLAMPYLDIIQGVLKNEEEKTYLYTYKKPSKEEVATALIWAQTQYKDVLQDYAKQSESKSEITAFAKLSAREMTLLGDLFLAGLDGTENLNAAKCCYNLAAKMKDGFAEYRMAELISKEESDQSDKFHDDFSPSLPDLKEENMTQIANHMRDQVNACMKKYGAYIEKKYKDHLMHFVSKSGDRKRMLIHYHNGCAMNFIPTYYYSGLDLMSFAIKYPDVFHIEDAVALLTKAAQKGYGMAQYELGRLFLQGVLPLSNPMLDKALAAKQFFAAAAAKGVPVAMWQYGLLMPEAEKWKFVRLAVSAESIDSSKIRADLWKSFSTQARTPALIYHATMALRVTAGVQELVQLQKEFIALFKNQPQIAQELMQELQDDPDEVYALLDNQVRDAIRMKAEQKEVHQREVRPGFFVLPQNTNDEMKRTPSKTNDVVKKQKRFGCAVQ